MFSTILMPILVSSFDIFFHLTRVRISCNYSLFNWTLGQSIKMFIRGRPITMYIPSNIQNYEELKMDPPSEKLELDWVYPLSVMVQGHLQNMHVNEKHLLHYNPNEIPWPAPSYGYRGRDCRGNLYMLPSGEAVYFIACVVVLYHVTGRTQRYYRKHTDCVRWWVHHINTQSIQKIYSTHLATIWNVLFLFHVLKLGK